MARRRYQRGQLFVRGKVERVWILRWWEDVIEDRQIRRVRRSVVIGTVKDFPTRRLAQREAEKVLVEVNSHAYRARPQATFEVFAASWEKKVLAHYKPSTQSNIRSHLARYLKPYFGPVKLQDIDSERIQAFLSSLKVGPYTAKNIVATMRAVWSSARGWGYVTHNPFDSKAVKFPRPAKAERFCFTLQDVRRIIANALEPHRTFYWLATETGMRVGELFGLRVDDVDLENCRVSVRQSIWQGRAQTPKSENARRSFALSPYLAEHLRQYLEKWQPNQHRLLFVTKRGTPWTLGNLTKRHFKPFLETLEIEVPRGTLFHAFRHTNSTLMDRAGIPVKVRQQRLGHADSRLTLDTYTHIDSADDRRFAKWVGEMLLKKEQEVDVNEDGSDIGPTLDSNSLGRFASV